MSRIEKLYGENWQPTRYTWNGTVKAWPTVCGDYEGLINVMPNNESPDYKVTLDNVHPKVCPIEAKEYDLPDGSRVWLRTVVALAQTALSVATETNQTDVSAHR